MHFATRAKNILFQPGSEWPAVSAEGTCAASLCTGYVLIMISMQTLCLMLGLFVAGNFGQDIGIGIVVAVCVAGFTLALLFTFSFALFTNRLARCFGAEANYIRALQLVGYASTPSWIGGAFGLVPFVGETVSVLAGIYGLYILHLGVPVMMRVPEGRVFRFTAILVFGAVILAMLVGAIQITIAGLATAGVRSTAIS